MKASIKLNNKNINFSFFPHIYDIVIIIIIIFFQLDYLCIALYCTIKYKFYSNVE
jgi:hypothetical protein